MRDVWHAWQQAGASFELFWNATEIPRENPNVYGKTTVEQDRVWRESVRDPGNLLHLARNPYMLTMLTEVFLDFGTVPANRGALFAGFVDVLLEREGMAGIDPLTQKVTRTAEGAALVAALTRLAYEMQGRRASGEGQGSAVTALAASEIVPSLMSAGALADGRRTNLLGKGEPVRFSHQLLQEYFVALHMQGQMDSQPATTLWPPDRWWERTNWEEAIVLLAGLYSDDCTRVLKWVQAANPEVAARCVERSGAATPDGTLAMLREAWLSRLRDMEREPHPKGRAAVGRALARIGDPRFDEEKWYLPKEPLLGFIEIPAGPFVMGSKDDSQAYEVARCRSTR